MAASSELSSEAMATLGTLPSGEGPVGRSIVADELLTIEDLTTEPEGSPLRRLAEAEGFRSAAIAPLRTNDGRVTGATVALFREPHRPPERYLQLVERYARRAADALDAARRLAESRQAQQNLEAFLTTLSHELRSPLAALHSAVEVLRHPGPEPAPRDELHAVIARQVQMLVRLADDLLDLARLGRGRMELHRGPLSVNAAVAEAVEAIRPALEAKRHRLEIDPAPDDPHVEADPLRLKQVLINLLQNAVRYTPEGGRIGVSAGRETDRVLIRSIRDNGIGIAPRELPHIFDLFRQAGDAHGRAGEGLGLGLALVRRLVELHGGTVAAYSAGPDLGSEFTVSLPLAAAALRARPAPSTDRAETSPLRVLVVEDHVDSATMIARVLRAAGHGVEVAHDAPAALELAARYPPDVALLDLSLPSMDGIQLARRLRSAGCPARLVMLSGDSVESSKLGTDLLDFAAHLTKPVSAADLLRALRPDHP